jgi:charged multivesicular body protein 5
MNRVFGKKKQAAPAPTLDDAASGLNGRIDGMDVKIAALESELRVYKDKIKKAKSPAAKQTLQKRAMEILKRKKMYEQQRDTTAGQGKNNNSNNTETLLFPLLILDLLLFLFALLDTDDV